MRYTVTDLLPEPSGTPRRLLAVEWMTYAFTGCSGPIAPEAAVTVDWGELPDLGGTSLTVPVVHGTFQLGPRGWAGAEMPRERRNPPSYSDINPVHTASVAEAQHLPYWRDPMLPAGWTLHEAASGGSDQPPYGYCAIYSTERGGRGVEICAGHVSLKFAWRVATTETGGVTETRVIAGYPGLIQYWPPHSDRRPYTAIQVWVYDAATNSAHTIRGIDPTVTGNNVEAAIAIARSLFEPPNPP